MFCMAQTGGVHCHRHHVALYQAEPITIVILSKLKHKAETEVLEPQPNRPFSKPQRFNFMPGIKLFGAYICMYTSKRH